MTMTVDRTPGRAAPSAMMPELSSVVRRLAVAALVLGAAPLAAQTLDDATLGRIDGWFQRAQRRAPGAWGIAIADGTGRLLWSHQAHQPLIPASTVKLFTTGFARSVVGPEARRATRVLTTGRVHPATGDLAGGWALELNGDPTLGRQAAAGPQLEDLARALADAGVRRLHGPLHVQSADGAPARAEYPAVWAARHRGRKFAPPVGALVLNENLITVTVAPATRTGRPAVLIGSAPAGLGSIVKVTAKTASGRRAKLGLTANRDGTWTVSGRIGVRAGPRAISAVTYNPQPVLQAAWAAALRGAGIAWDQREQPSIGEPGEPRVLAEVQSAVFDTVASEVNRRSLNIGAEALLRWGGGLDRDAPQRLTRHVREVTGESEVLLVDGSGLSYDNRAAPLAFVKYLARFPQLPGGRNFPLLLPANGEGTLRRMNRGLAAPGVVRAKTGTLGNVATVSGYLGRPDGTLIVSLMYNGGTPWSARQMQWELFRLLGAEGAVVPGEGPEPLQLGGDAEP